MHGVNYLDDLTEKLRSVEVKISEARKHLESGKPANMVLAAGELTILESRHRELAEKIEAAKGRHAEDWSLLHTELQEDYDAITNSLGDWVTRH
jgi:hypothetical protein